MTRIEELARKLNQEILALEVVQEYQKYEKLVLNDEKLKQLEKELKVLQKKIVNQFHVRLSGAKPDITH